jgi:hypothetical protein
VATERWTPEEIPRVEHYRHEHPPVRDVNEEFQNSFTPMERIALFVTNHVGILASSWSFLPGLSCGWAGTFWRRPISAMSADP